MNIRKQLRFTYRYLTTSRRWRSWINTQVLIALAALAIFTVALAWSTPGPANGAGAAQAVQTLTPNPSLDPTNTPFPQEYLNNSQQTIGITFAGAILVLIVVIGVIVFLPKSADQ
ncbi:MAG: hypothetical protein EHM21_03355 [Chloroflexi bacterium]|nr:MAG: hypothetical protein EHM21_03355 [Chloroflexota bacterium]